MDTTRNGYFTLSFEVVFEEEDDFNMLSLSLPYSYTKLINTLSDLETQATGNEHISWQMTTIAYSLGNNQVPYLSITSRTAN